MELLALMCLNMDIIYGMIILPFLGFVCVGSLRYVEQP